MASSQEMEWVFSGTHTATCSGPTQGWLSDNEHVYSHKAAQKKNSTKQQYTA